MLRSSKARILTILVRYGDLLIPPCRQILNGEERQSYVWSFFDLFHASSQIHGQDTNSLGKQTNVMKAPVVVWRNSSSNGSWAVIILLPVLYCLVKRRSGLNLCKASYSQSYPSITASQFQCANHAVHVNCVTH